MPFYFDLSDEGAAGDPDARKFVTRVRKDLAGNSVAPPRLFAMTPDGEVVGSADNDSSAEEVLKMMLEALEEKPEFAAPAEGEAGLTGLDAARLRFELGDLKGALGEAKAIEGPEARLFAAKVLRHRRAWADAAAELDRVTEERFADDVRMERAHGLWHGEKFEELRELLKDFPEKSARYTEARYYEGLACYHLGKKKTAAKIWKATIESREEDRWIYRADWAWADVKQGTRMAFSSADEDRTPLGRIGYMGRRNPDLSGPK